MGGRVKKTWFLLASAALLITWYSPLQVSVETYTSRASTLASSEVKHSPRGQAQDHKYSVAFLQAVIDT